MNCIFSTRKLKHYLQTQINYFRNSLNGSKYGLNSLRYLLLRFGKLFTKNIKKSLEDFKDNIRKWEPNTCLKTVLRKLIRIFRDD